MTYLVHHGKDLLQVSSLKVISVELLTEGFRPYVIGGSSYNSREDCDDFQFVS